MATKTIFLFLFIFSAVISSNGQCDPPTLGESFVFIRKVENALDNKLHVGEEYTLRLYVLKFRGEQINTNVARVEWRLGDQVYYGDDDLQLRFTVPPLPSGRYTVRAIPLNDCNESDPRVAPITRNFEVVNPCEPDAILEQLSTGALCADGATSYTFSMQNTLETYTWQVKNGEVVSSTGTQAEVTFDASGPAQVTAIRESNGSCRYTVRATVEAQPQEVSKVTGVFASCQNSTQVYTVKGGEGATVFNWSFPNGLAHSFLDPERRSAQVTFNGMGDFTISVTPANDCGTAGTYAFVVNAEEDLQRKEEFVLSDAQLSAKPTEDLVLNTCIERRFDCRAILRDVDLNITLDLGEEYQFGEADFKVSVAFTLTGTGTNGTLFTRSETLVIDQNTPEMLFHQFYDSNLESLRRLRVQIDDYSVAGEVAGAVRLRAHYTDRNTLDIENIGLSSFSADALATGWDVRYHWQSKCDDLQAYQFRLLKVFDGETIPTPSDRRWQNALTLQLQQPEVMLTMAEGSGRYAWQVRPIGNLTGGANNPENIRVPWPAQVQEFTFSQPDEDRNFIYSRTFTEGNRTAEQLTFANGLQQVQQQQTRLNASQQVVATQTLQDFSGRDVVQSLPVPVNGKSALGYHPRLMTDGSSGYDAGNFDADGTVENPDNAYLDQKPGDQGYYGGVNNGLNDGVASAEGVPYTRSVFMNDGTGRVRKQAGVGGMHSMKGPHTVRYFYTGVAQQELDYMFGDQAPLAENTYKQLTVDANNTTSVAYNGKDGKTMATALVIGTGNENLDGLDSRASATKTITENITEKAPLSENLSSSRKRLVFTLPAVINVNYTLSPATVDDVCSSTCKTCDYVVTFILHDLEDPDNTRQLADYTLNADAVNCAVAATHTRNFSVSVEAGDYALEKRVQSLNRSSTTGNWFIDDHLTELRDHYNAEIATVFDPVDAYIRGEAVDLEGLYAYLETQGYTRIDPVEGPEYYEVPVGCEGDLITIPVLEDNCTVDIDCSNLAGQDFVSYFVDYWSAQFASGRFPAGEANPGDLGVFGGVTTYEWLGYRYRANASPVFLTPAEFNTMMGNLLQETDAAGNYLYDCQLVWKVWQQQVMNYRYLRDMVIDPDDLPADAGSITFSFNLIDNFLQTLEIELKALETDPERQIIRQESFYTSAPDAAEKANLYKVFYYNSADERMNNCMVGYIGYYNSLSTTTTPCQQPTVQEQFDCLPVTERHMIYQCIKFGVEEGEDDKNEKLAIMLNQCNTTCESKRPALRQAIIDDARDQGLYVEGDAFTLERDPVTGINRPTGAPRDPQVFDLSLCELDEMEQALVVNCQNYCQLDFIEDENGNVVAVGTEEQLSNLQKVLTADFEVEVNMDGGTSCGAGWDIIQGSATLPGGGEIIVDKLEEVLYIAGNGTFDSKTVYTDDEGNAYLYLRYESEIILGNGLSFSNSDNYSDLILMKISQQGDILWYRNFEVSPEVNPLSARQFSTLQAVTSTNDQIQVSVSSGNIYLTGYYEDSNWRIEEEQTTFNLTAQQPDQQGFLIKVSTDGQINWGVADIGSDVYSPPVVDQNDNIYHIEARRASDRLGFGYIRLVKRNAQGQVLWTGDKVYHPAQGTSADFNDLHQNYLLMDGGEQVYIIRQVDSGDVYLNDQLEISREHRGYMILKYNSEGLVDLKFIDYLQFNNASNMAGWRAHAMNDGFLLFFDRSVVVEAELDFDGDRYPFNSFRLIYAHLGSDMIFKTHGYLQYPEGGWIRTPDAFNILNGQPTWIVAADYPATPQAPSFSRVAVMTYDLNTQDFTIRTIADPEGGQNSSLNEQIVHLWPYEAETSGLSLLVRASADVAGNDSFFGAPVDTQAGFQTIYLLNFRENVVEGCQYRSTCFRFGDPLTEITIPEGFDPYVFTAEPYTCEELNTQEVVRTLDAQQNAYITGKLRTFREKYNTRCADATNVNDDFTLSYDLGYHHYTLYYYDRAGNLMRTVPPKGFNTSDPDGHTLITDYHYNSLGQLVKQNSPDGGETFFYYNDLGQLRFSQNALQATDGAYSYTKYDELGRIVEVGESSEGPDVFRARTNSSAFPQAGTEQTVTRYTERYVGALEQPQRYLRNRVSYTYLDEDGLDATLEDRTYTIYSYDPHGNVEWMVQRVPGLPDKRITYDYDLISGNVLQVSYNPGNEDQFFHRYEYDADNRIVSVATSVDGKLWDTDATYEYYPHGPLKTVNIGEDNLQKLDYLYTIHGWLKALNDPEANEETGTFGKDAFAMALRYYSGDYTGTNTAVGQLAAAPARDLFNGNISAWEMSTYASDRQWMRTGYQYRYDELNRIRDSRFNVFRETDGFLDREGFHADFALDANGNLQTLNRNDIDAVNFDALTYHLNTGNNQLDRVEDAVLDAGLHPEDVESQTVDNYTYDQIGNLTRDAQEDMDIEWTVYGKVDALSKGNGAGTEFTYDAAGNRVKKQTADEFGNVYTTYYVRDASGNIMGTYREQTVDGVSTPATLSEVPIYGSDRIGVYTPAGAAESSQENAVSVAEDQAIDTYEGVSYELENGVTFTLQPGFTFEDGVDGSNFTVSASQAGTAALAEGVYARRLDLKQYELKDHLGNVRTVISDRKQSEISGGTPENFEPTIVSASAYYPYGMDLPTVRWEEQIVTGTIEPENAPEEILDFDNYPELDIVPEPNPETGSSRSFKLTGADGSIIGLSKSLKVQAGDKISASVLGKYLVPEEDALATNVPALLGAAFLSAFTGPAIVDGGAIGDLLSDWSTGSAALLGAKAPNSNDVFAGINWLAFDNDFNLVTGGYSQLTTAAANDFQQLDLADYIVEQDGYIFIYTSNESPQLSEVFFDDMTVTHEKLVPDEAYDPGLVAYRYGFNGKEKDQQGEWGLNHYDYGFRIYNPSIARFLSVDPLMKSYPMLTPYQFAANKPINGIDLDGLEWVLKIYSPENSTKFLEATNSDDIYRQREITYYSLQRDFPDNYAPKVTIGEASPKAAELFYDESARRGLTVTTYSGVYDKQGELVRAYPNAQKQFYDPDDQAVNYDHSWPVDIRATSAWEERFGKEYVGPDGEDVDLKLFSFGVELYGPNNSKGTQIFSGRLKGFGPVSLTVGTVASNGLGLDINIMGGYFGKFNGSGEAPLLNAINGLNGTFDFNSNGFSSENWTIFGGSVGAPIPLPKMFEGAQKLFEKTEGKAQFEVTNPKK